MSIRFSVISFLCVTTFLFSFWEVVGQNIPVHQREIVIIGTDDVNRVFIPPSDDFYLTKGTKGAQFEVAYFNFPIEASTAFDYAVGIWSSLLSSEVKIRVSARWVNMEGSTLGSALIPSLFEGSEFQAPYSGVLYPASLAERIARRPVNDNSRYDIEVRFNLNVNWYFGLDGATPADSYDFVTVVLHELCHGLGFFGTFGVSGTSGFYGENGKPAIYDIFVHDIQGRELTNTSIYPNPSQDLRDALTSGALYFAGPMTRAYLDGSVPSLYVPGIFSSGSSISHLSESATQQKYALMTPFIARGEAIHDPGGLTMAIMGDLGWTNTWLYHDDLKDTEEALSLIPFSLQVVSDTLLKSEGVRLRYRFSDEDIYSSAVMSYSGSDNIYSYDLVSPPYESNIYYYFTTTDIFNREYNYPYRGEKNPVVFYVGTDTIPPLISHNPGRYILSILDTLVISATITDNIPSPTARVEYKLNSSGQIESEEMINNGGSDFTGRISVSNFSFMPGDTLYYRIVAVDQANEPNSSRNPLSGFHKLPVHNMFEPVENYFNPFSSGVGDFITYGFSVEQPSGFTNPALHTIHPYEVSGTADKNIEYEAILRHPLVIDTSGLFISFIEVVLVEPGLHGSSHLDSRFRDYVIVEGSSNGGRSWFPLVNGYDSRKSGAWLDAYFRLMSGSSSETPGSSDLFESRVISIDTSDIRINAGDNVIIRFRLSSDKENNAWGWVVDNMFVKGIASGTESVSSTKLTVYPNPGDGRFTLVNDAGFFSISDRIEVTEFSGRVVWSSFLPPESNSRIDISHLPPGLYNLRIITNGIPAALRYIKVR